MEQLWQSFVLAGNSSAFDNVQESRYQIDLMRWQRSPHPHDAPENQAHASMHKSHRISAHWHAETFRQSYDPSTPRFQVSPSPEITSAALRTCFPVSRLEKWSRNERSHVKNTHSSCQIRLWMNVSGDNRCLPLIMGIRSARQLFTSMRIGIICNSEANRTIVTQHSSCQKRVDAQELTITIHRREILSQSVDPESVDCDTKCA